jgi:hypothetical protein
VLLFFVFLGALACGGAAQDEAASGGAGASQASGGGEGGESGGDIRVSVDDPAEGAMVVLDEQGRIGFETNVRLELETMPGTSGAAAQQLGQAIQAKMVEIRTCYDRAVASDPEVEGSLQLVLATDARGRASSEVSRAGFTGGRITECVTRLLQRLPRTELPASARIQVVLIASNTMAAGTRDVREHREHREQQGGASPHPKGCEPPAP